MASDNAMLGWRNAFLSGTLLASSQASADLAITNLQNQQGSSAMAWQSTGCAAEWIFLKATSALQMWQVIALTRTNLTSSAQMRIQIGSDGGSGAISDPIFDSGFGPCNVVVQNGVGYMQTIYILAAAQLGQCLRIDIQDPTNPDGFLNIPLAFAGPVFQPEVNFDFSGSEARADGTTETTTRGGQEFPLTPWMRRATTISYQGLTEDEGWDDLMELDAVARTNQNVLFIPLPGGPYQNRQTVFGRFKPSGGLSWPFQSPEKRSYKFTISERL